jgi:hypothetical protein
MSAHPLLIHADLRQLLDHFQLADEDEKVHGVKNDTRAMVFCSFRDCVLEVVVSRSPSRESTAKQTGHAQPASGAIASDQICRTITRQARNRQRVQSEGAKEGMSSLTCTIRPSLPTNILLSPTLYPRTCSDQPDDPRVQRREIQYPRLYLNWGGGS